MGAGVKVGDLTKRAAFQRPLEGPDEDANLITDYPVAFEAWVNLRPLRGGESVMAARMQSYAPAIVTFPTSAQARAVTSEWRVVIDGRTYEAKEDPRETQDQAFLEMLVEAGA